MRVERESTAIGNDIKHIAGKARDGVRDAFDPNVRAAKKAINEAKKEIGTARAEAEIKVLKAETKQLVKDIKAGTAPVEKVVVKVEKAAKRGIAGNFARAGFWVVEQPIALLMKPVKWISGAAAKRPITAAVIGAGAVAAAIGNSMARNKAGALQAQADTMEAMAAAQAAAPQVSYMNSASYADVQAKIDADRAAGMAPGSQAEALAARQGIPAPEAAGAGPAV